MHTEGVRFRDFALLFVNNFPLPHCDALRPPLIHHLFVFAIFRSFHSQVWLPQQVKAAPVGYPLWKYVSTIITIMEAGVKPVPHPA